MKAYLETLYASVALADRARATASRNRSNQGRVLCDKPIADQITELMQSLSPAQRDRLWTMEEFIARLHGRYRIKPHPMRVGGALRALGWVTKRDWTVQGGGRRYWFPGPVK